MGAERQGRALTVLALALVAMVPSIAMAKTLEGTKTGSDPLHGTVPGPPATGTVAPMIVPPSTAPGDVSPSAAKGADVDEESDADDASAEGRGSESGLPSDPAGSSPVRTTPSTGHHEPTAVSSVGPRDAGSTTTLFTMPPAASRPAGPGIPLRPGATSNPAALALRDRAATAPDAGTRFVGVPAITTGGPPTTAASSPLASLSGAAGHQGTTSFVNCATLPSPGASNDRIVWTSARTAEITAGRDLNSTERVGTQSGTSVIWDPSSPVEAYVIHPDTFAVMARFTALGERSDELVGFLDQPLPGLRISECDGRPAAGIAPGTYVLRYAFTGTTTSAFTVAPETFLSPPVSVRVIAGPTAPTIAAATKR